MMNIKTENLHKTYLRKNLKPVEALKNINIDISSGEKISIIGHSGSGKSTLIHILGLMDTPTEGKVLIDGKDYFELADSGKRQMRKENIGFIFQFHYLLADFTVLENILIPVWDKKDEYLKRAEAMLERIEISDRKNHYPNELSGGEQQRAALARALINSPKILFADEPTGNLDSNSGAGIENLLFEISTQNSMTLIVVTHNEKLASKSDRILKMEDGGIK
ncbi:MAG: ABC transporter ATP-binding protein [Elusimicrobiota bacterium]|jgi:lipoprotein-releasing system ATP-binding protein|nr:ABC transporter ATP-binding protein [Elusimicrobiota bacterium]